MLIIEQILDYMLNEEETYSLKNPPPTERTAAWNDLLRILDECVSFGLEHCLNNIFFLFRMLFYLLSLPMYYYLLEKGTLTWDSAQEFIVSMLKRADELFPGSMFFLELKDVSITGGKWRYRATMEEKIKIQEELAEFHLQENAMDREILFEYDWIFE